MCLCCASPSSASLILRFRSYATRSLPSKLFLYRYSRRRRVFLLIMLDRWMRVAYAASQVAYVASHAQPPPGVLLPRLRHCPLCACVTSFEFTV